MRKIIISILAIFAYLGVIAQQQAMFTHYSFNTLAVNPAYAGSRDALTVTGLYRNQWVGFEGAPVTQTLTVHTPVIKQLGLGLSILNDKIGPTSSTSLYADVSYSIPFSDTKNSKLAFGLKSGINLLQSNLNQVNTDNSSDNSFSGIESRQALPNFGLGAYYHNDKWYAGLSSPTIIQNSISTLKGTDGAKEIRHYFLIAGAVFDLNENLKFKPTTYLKVTKSVPLELDLTGMFILKEKLELGAMLRTTDAFGALLGYNVKPNMRLGYSYDFSYGNTTLKYNGGSHELMFRYDFIYNENKKIKSPRYF